MIVSERPKPVVSAPGSLLSFWRRSEPSTRMLLAEVSGKPDGSSTLARSGGRRCALEVRADQEQHERQRQPGDDQREQAEDHALGGDPLAPSRAGALGRTGALGAQRVEQASSSAPWPAAALRRGSGCTGWLVGWGRASGGTYICAMNPDNPPVQTSTDGRLLVCATPIGNLEDVTLRVLRGAARGRHGRVRGHAPHANAARSPRHPGARLVSLHEHNERARAQRAGGTSAGGGDGCAGQRRGHAAGVRPGIRARAGVHSEGLAVEVLPGASAAVVALVASGLPADRWRFVGFLPRKRAELERLLARSQGDDGCLRVPAAPARRRWSCWPRSTPSATVAVCRELTKLHEEVRRGSAAELADHYARHPPRGEIALAIGAVESDPAEPLDPTHPRREEAIEALRELVRAGAEAAACRGGGGEADGDRRERAVSGADALLRTEGPPNRSRVGASGRRDRRPRARLRLRRVDG